MKKPILKTQFSGKTIQSSGFKKKMGKSMTVPDQNLTVKELLDRHSRGVSLGAPEIKGEYFDTEIPKFDDLTDALEYKKNLIKKANELEKQIKEGKVAKVKAKAKPINAKSEDEVSQADNVSEAKPTTKATEQQLFC